MKLFNSAIASVLAGLVLALSVTSASAADEAPKHDLQKAFFKEYSFLLKEKKAMQKRLQQLKAQMRREKSQMNKELDALKSDNDALLLETDRINENIATLERETIAKESNQSVLDATFEQASASLNQKGEPELSGIEATIAKGLSVLDRNASVHTEAGKFYLQNGTEVEGDILHFGAVARFGVNDDYSGPLAPTGGGEFKLWQPSSQTVVIEQLKLGVMPVSAELFLFESETKEVKSVEEKDVLTIINSGGLIAWIIVVLGGVALLFAFIRGMFLLALGRNSSKRFAEIADQVANGQLEDAKQSARAAGGSLKRVMQATLNNLHRDREHVEDTISEAILHEHTHLDRFHSLIMVIAAISPLLGLLGTVTGMIETFDIITEFGTGDPKLLSGGISIALVTTELGLVVAIPVLVIGTLLSSWGNKIKDDIERSALHLVNQYQNQIDGHKA